MLFELAFAGQFCLSDADRSPQSGQIHQTGRRQHRHGERAVEFHDHGLGQEFARDMRDRSNTLGGISLGVRDDNVLHFMAVEEGFHFGEVHIELLATFRGPSARKDVTDATNWSKASSSASSSIVLLIGWISRGCSRLLGKSLDHSGYLLAVG